MSRSYPAKTIHSNRIEDADTRGELPRIIIDGFNITA